jgi:hypothetical protein
MGTVRDMASRVVNIRKYFLDLVSIARRAIYGSGHGIASAAVERLLFETSSVPTVV